MYFGASSFIYLDIRQRKLDLKPTMPSKYAKHTIINQMKQRFW